MESTPHPYSAMRVQFADEQQPVTRFVYSPYGQRPGAMVIVAIASELERWITCVVESVTSNDLHVKRLYA